MTPSVLAMLPGPVVTGPAYNGDTALRDSFAVELDRAGAARPPKESSRSTREPAQDRVDDDVRRDQPADADRVPDDRSDPVLQERAVSEPEPTTPVDRDEPVESDDATVSAEPVTDAATMSNAAVVVALATAVEPAPTTGTDELATEVEVPVDTTIDVADGPTDIADAATIVHHSTNVDGSTRSGVVQSGDVAAPTTAHAEPVAASTSGAVVDVIDSAVEPVEVDGPSITVVDGAATTPAPARAGGEATSPSVDSTPGTTAPVTGENPATTSDGGAGDRGAGDGGATDGQSEPASTSVDGASDGSSTPVEEGAELQVTNPVSTPRVANTAPSVTGVSAPVAVDAVSAVASGPVGVSSSGRVDEPAMRASIERVMATLDVIAKQPPPRVLTLDLSELHGVRITLALDEGTVSASVADSGAGESHARQWQEQLDQLLDERRFGSGAGQNDTDEPGSPTTATPNPRLASSSDLRI